MGKQCQTLFLGAPKSLQMVIAAMKLKDTYSQLVHSIGDQPWDFFERNDAKAETPVFLATSCKELTHWKRFWCWEELGGGGEGDDRGWDGWLASLARWTWVWVNSGSWWWTERPGMLQFMGLQRVGHDWATELNWTEGYGQEKDWEYISFEINTCSYKELKKKYTLA